MIFFLREPLMFINRLRHYYIFPLVVVILIILPPLMTAAKSNSHSLIKKQSLQLAFRICSRGSQAYYPNIDPKTIDKQCKNINKYAATSITHCIDQSNLLQLFTHAFRQCLIQKLQQNTAFVRQVLSSIVTICKLSAVQMNAKIDSKKLDTLCKQTAPIEMQYIVRHFQHHL